MNIKLQNRKFAVERKIETLRGELSNLNSKIYPKYVVVIDDSNCTVKIGGPGRLWEVDPSSNYSRGFYNLKGRDGYVIYNYDQSMFRAATEEEIDNWLKTQTQGEKKNFMNTDDKIYNYGDIRKLFDEEYAIKNTLDESIVFCDDYIKEIIKDKQKNIDKARGITSKYCDLGDYDYVATSPDKTDEPRDEYDDPKYKVS